MILKKKYSRKEIFERASKTFIQGFIGSLAITLPNTDFTTKGVWQSVLIGALASGISALMNYFSNLLEDEEEIEMLEDEEEIEVLDDDVQ